MVKKLLTFSYISFIIAALLSFISIFVSFTNGINEQAFVFSLYFVANLMCATMIHFGLKVISD